MPPRESMNLTQEQWEEIQKRKGGDAKRLSVTAVEGKGTNLGVALPSTRDRSSNAAPVKSKTGAMNKTEYEYSLELEARKQAREILWWGFEAIKIKLTGRTFFTPDFAMWAMRPGYAAGIEWVQAEPRLQFAEIKGFLRDDANVKFKIAAELFPWAEFFMYRKQKGGGWELIKHLNGGR